MSEVRDVSPCHILKIQRVCSTMGKIIHTKACYCKMVTREDTSDLSTATSKEQCETTWNMTSKFWRILHLVNYRYSLKCKVSKIFNSHVTFLKKLLGDVISQSEQEIKEKGHRKWRGARRSQMRENQEHSKRRFKKDRCAPDIERNSPD